MATATVEKALLIQAPLNPVWWGRAHRVMATGKPYRIMGRGHFYMPYLYEPLCEWMKGAPKGQRQVWSKAAQLGITEAALTLSLWFLNVCEEGALYGLPSEDQIKSFVAARVNPTIRNSPTISAAFKDTDNTDVKLGWGRPWYFRGAVSRSKLREIPAGLLVRDEYGEMGGAYGNTVGEKPVEGRELMVSRLGASRFKWILDLGNPHYPETGIDAEYKGGDQSAWVIKCECGVEEEPRWPESVQKTGDEWALVCPECGKPVDKFAGRWVPTNPGAPYRSFRMSQMISPAVDPYELALAWEQAQNNPTRLQEFYNSRLGLPYAPAGTKLTDEILLALPRRGEMALGATRPMAMGVDVNPGAGNHVFIREQTGDVVWAGLLTWDEMDLAMVRYRVAKCCIDYAPETTKVREFARKFPGKVEAIRYNPSPTSTGESRGDDEGVTVRTVARTEVIDRAFQRVIGGEVGVPVNVPVEVFAHLKAMTRQIVKTGVTEYAAWVESGPDHYAHALVYSELALDERPAWQQAGVYI